MVAKINEFFVYLQSRPYLNKVIKNSGWLYLDKFSRLLVSLFIGIFIVRYLGPTDFGDFSFVLAIIGTITPLAAFGISTILSRDLLKYPKKRDVILSTALCVRLLVAVGCVVALLLLLFFSGVSTTIFVLAFILSFSFLFDSFNTLNSLFDSDLNSKYIIIVSQIVLVISSVLKVVFLVIQSPLEFFIIVSLIESILSAVFLWFFFKKKYPTIRISPIINWTVAKDLVKSGFPFMIAGIGAVLYMHADQVIVGYMLLPVSVGFYAIAVKLSEFFYFVPAVFSTSLFPKLVILYKNKPVEYKARLQEFFDLLTLVVLPSVIIVCLFSNEIITFIYGAEYGLAAPVLSIYIISSIFVFFGMAAQNHLVIEDLGKITLYRAVFGAIINVLLSIIFVYYFGLVGAAYATLICFAFVFWASFFLFKKTRFLFFMFLSSFNFARTIPHFLKKGIKFI